MIFIYSLTLILVLINFVHSGVKHGKTILGVVVSKVYNLKIIPIEIFEEKNELII